MRPGEDVFTALYSEYDRQVAAKAERVERIDELLLDDPKEALRLMAEMMLQGKCPRDWAGARK